MQSNYHHEHANSLVTTTTKTDDDDDCFLSWAWILAHQLPIEPVGGRGGDPRSERLIFPTKYVIPKSLSSAIGQVSFCNNLEQTILQLLFVTLFLQAEHNKGVFQTITSKHVMCEELKELYYKYKSHV